MMESLFPGACVEDLTRFSKGRSMVCCLGRISINCDWFWMAQGLYAAIKPALSQAGSELLLFTDEEA